MNACTDASRAAEAAGIDAAHQAEIAARLQQVQAEHGVRIVLAVESGSRAWGFASPDSDYDVRFVYVRPPSHYLSIRVEDRRDVIEPPIVDDVDLNGWDLRKALRLLARCNPAIVEWLHSPITYVEQGSFRAEARALLPQIYTAERGLHHYRHMAAGNHRGYLRGERVRLKKYFYVLRPLLAVRWIEAFGTPPPLAFESLLQALDLPEPLLAAVHELLERKRATPELGEGPSVQAIQAFIEAELARPLLGTAPSEARHAVGRPAGSETAPGVDPWAALDALFGKLLFEAGGWPPDQGFAL